MKIKVHIVDGHTTVTALDNKALFNHCVGVDIGSNYLGYCSLEEYENRVEELLTCHGITDFEVVTNVEKILNEED